MSTLVVAYELEGDDRKIVADGLGGAAETIYLPSRDEAARAAALRKADAVLVRTLLSPARSVSSGHGILGSGGRR